MDDNLTGVFYSVVFSVFLCLDFSTVSFLSLDFMSDVSRYKAF